MKRITLVLISIFILFSCKKDELQREAKVETNSVSEITATTAKATGDIIDLGKGISDYGHCWGFNENPTISDFKTSLGAATKAGVYTSELENLEPGKLYHIRAYVATKDAVVYGDDKQFTTLAPPVLTSTAATAITSSSADIGGNITKDGGATVTDRGVYWREASNTDTIGTKLQVGDGTGTFTTTLNSLKPNTSYTFKAYATNSVGTSYGAKLSFITAITLPTVTTTSISDITSISATGGGEITADGGSSVTARGICWDSSVNPTTALTTKTSDGTGSGIFTSSITGLTPGATYHVRAYAINVAGTAYGDDKFFSASAVPPIVTTTSPTAITSSSATGGGNITSNGGAAISARGVCWSITENPTIALTTKTNDGTDIGSFTSSITGLSPGTIYHVRAYATNSAGISYGDDVSFNTLANLPTLTTATVTAITTSNATSGGTITSNGGGTITEKGVCWSTLPDPTIADSKTTNGTGTGTFTSNITGLFPTTTYYVRAYAINSAGIGYGDEVTFNTSANSPSLTTSPITDITANTAVSGGTITSDGGDAITAQGVCWSITQHPTITNSFTTDATGTTTYISNLTGLQHATIYYVRAYATNSIGTGYGDEISFTTLADLPTLTTTSITAITTSSSTSGGNIISDGGGIITERGVCWSTSADPTIELATKTSDGTGAGIFISSITDLSPGAEYHVRAYAKNDGGTAYGEDKTFITIPLPPTVITSDITNIILPEATCGGNATDVSADGPGITARGVCWGTTPTPTISNYKTLDGSGNGNFTSTLTGLQSATTYYVRAYATNAGGTGYGEEKTFTTPIILPSLTTNTITAITTNSATSGGNITSDGGATVTTRGICWSNIPNPTISDSKTTDGSGSGTFTSNIIGLQSVTTYYVRAYAVNSVGIGYGDETSFTTAADLPILTTVAITDITTNTASGGGNITSDGGAVITERGVCWSTSNNPTITLSTKTSDGAGSGSFTSSIAGLTQVTVYHVRAYATNSAGTSYGNEVTFTTSANLPTVTTTSVTAITTTSATSGGNITSDGGATIPERGVCWSTSTDPTTDLTTKTSDETGAGSYTSNITGLAPGSSYHVRAYATNSAGTSYGEDVTFSALADLPTLSTTAITDITANTATSGGNITSDGGGAVTARGVCWSTIANPTITLTTKTTNGTGTGGFTSNLTGLTSSTTYYIRSYATNSAGTGYGNEISFATGIAPTVITSDISIITSTTFICGGNVTVSGGSPVISRGVCWSTSTNATIDNNKTIDGSGTGAFSSSVSGLSPNTTYYVRAYAINTSGIGYGEEKSCVTLIIPTVATADISGITALEAIGGGEVTFDGNTNVTERGVCWSTSQNPSIVDSYTTDGSGMGSFTSLLENLNPNTTYNVRAYATNSVGTAYGAQKSFITGITLPTISTVNITEISGKTATSGGNITSNGGTPITARGICWSTSQNPNINDFQTYDGSGEGNYISNLTNLVPLTTYYVRAYAINSVGTSYGNEISFTTTDGSPILTTSIITGLMEGNAVGGGNIISDGGFSIISKGVCWSISPNPTILNMNTSDGNGTDPFTSILTGLTLNTTYYARAYATNSVGTSYGNEIIFTYGLGIGNTYAGGIVFYIDGTLEHGLVCAPSDQSIGAPWGCYGTEISGADGYVVGAGMQNTLDIINGCSENNTAARICYNLVLNGYDDWFLPSTEEFRKMYSLIDAGIGNFASDHYWTSRENSNQFAWIVLSPSQSSTNFKNYSYHVRAVRAF